MSAFVDSSCKSDPEPDPGPPVHTDTDLGLSSFRKCINCSLDLEMEMQDNEGEGIVKMESMTDISFTIQVAPAQQIENGEIIIEQKISILDALTCIFPNSNVALHSLNGIISDELVMCMDCGTALTTLYGAYFQLLNLSNVNSKLSNLIRQIELWHTTNSSSIHVEASEILDEYVTTLRQNRVTAGCQYEEPEVPVPDIQIVGEYSQFQPVFAAGASSSSSIGLALPAVAKTSRHPRAVELKSTGHLLVLNSDQLPFLIDKKTTISSPSSIPTRKPPKVYKYKPRQTPLQKDPPVETGNKSGQPKLIDWNKIQLGSLSSTSTVSDPSTSTSHKQDTFPEKTSSNTIKVEGLNRPTIGHPCILRLSEQRIPTPSPNPEGSKNFTKVVLFPTPHPQPTTPPKITKKDVFNVPTPQKGTGPRFICPVCSKKCLYKWEMEMHNLSAHEKKVPSKCIKCDFLYYEPELFLNHSCTPQYNRHIPYRKDYRCIKCGKCFTNSSAWIQHRRTHEEGFVDRKEKKLIALAQKELQREKDDIPLCRPKITKNAPRFPCSVSECSATFIFKWEMEMHQLIMHENTVPDECDKCNFKYLDQKLFDTHSCVTKETRNAEELKFRCNYCGMCLKSRHKWFYHRRIHEKVQCNFKCPVEGCPKSFYSEKILKYHTRMKHSGKPKKKYPRPPSQPCPDCGKLLSKESLRLHKIQKHSTGLERIHMCHKCGKSFQFMQVLRRHERYAHSNSRPYKCPLCSVSFKGKQELKTHWKGKIHSKEEVADLLAAPIVANVAPDETPILPPMGSGRTRSGTSRRFGTKRRRHREQIEELDTSASGDLEQAGGSNQYQHASGTGEPMEGGMGNYNYFLNQYHYNLR